MVPRIFGLIVPPNLTTFHQEIGRHLPGVTGRPRNAVPLPPGLQALEPGWPAKHLPTTAALHPEVAGPAAFDVGHKLGLGPMSPKESLGLLLVGPGDEEDWHRLGPACGSLTQTLDLFRREESAVVPQEDDQSCSHWNV